MTILVFPEVGLRPLFFWWTLLVLEKIKIPEIILKWRTV